MELNEQLRLWLDGADPHWMAESAAEAGSERDTEIEARFFDKLAAALHALAEPEP